MLVPRKRFITILFIGLAVAVTLAASGKRYWLHAIPKTPKEATNQRPPVIPVAQRIYVRTSSLPPKLRWNLNALGDRLERRGKEQLIIHGSLTRSSVEGSAPVTLSLEPANRMTMNTKLGIQDQTIAFDGNQSLAPTLADADRSLVETLVFDTAESFFVQQMKGAATRCLGYGFRPDEQNTAGPFHDIYAVMPVDSLLGDLQGAKLFYFNSDTLLLDRITYQTTGRVEVRFSNWQQTNGQKVARRIERFENGVNVMTLAIRDVVIGPSVHSEPK